VVIGGPVIPNSNKQYYKLWEPNNQALWNANFDELPINSVGTKGIAIVVNRNCFSEKMFMDNFSPLSAFKPESLFSLPNEVTTTLAEIATFFNSTNILINKAVQGYVQYVQDCLDIIYKTQSGKKLLDFLRNGDVLITINLSEHGNSVSSFDTRCDIAKILFGTNLTVDECNRLKKVLQEVSQIEDEIKRFDWFADQINKAPLLTHFGIQDLDSGFLTAKANSSSQRNVKVKADDLRNWFTKGSLEIRNTKFGEKFFGDLEVTKHTFIQQAVTILFYKQAQVGIKSGSAVSFKIKNSGQNKNRPAAIGLAHELVHAYYNANGMQPGVDVDSESTVLYEMICVGLGPWDSDQTENSTYFSENRFRKEWASVRSSLGNNDPSNLLPTPKRTSYIPSTT
jgi:hypothetical protein